MITKEKQKSLAKYAAELVSRLASPTPQKHVLRGSQGSYKRFLEQELANTKATLEKAAG